MHSLSIPNANQQQVYSLDSLYSSILGTNFYIFLRNQLQSPAVTHSDIKQVLRDNYRLIRAKQIQSKGHNRHQYFNIQSPTHTYLAKHRLNQSSQTNKQQSLTLHDINTMYTIQSKESIVLLLLNGEIDHSEQKYRKGDFIIAQASGSEQSTFLQPGKSVKVQVRVKYTRQTMLMIINYHVFKHRIQRLNQVYQKIDYVSRNLALDLCNEQLRRLACMLQIRRFSEKYVKLAVQSDFKAEINGDSIGHTFSKVFGEEIEDNSKLNQLNFKAQCNQTTLQETSPQIPKIMGNISCKLLQNSKKSDNEHISLSICLPAKIYLIIKGTVQFCYKNTTLIQIENSYIYMTTKMIEKGYMLRSKSPATEIGVIDVRLVLSDYRFQNIIYQLIHRQISKQYLNRIQILIKNRELQKKRAIKIRKMSKSKSKSKDISFEDCTPVNKSVELKLAHNQQTQVKKFIRSKSSRQTREKMLCKSQPSFSPKKIKFSTSNVHENVEAKFKGFNCQYSLPTSNKALFLKSYHTQSKSFSNRKKQIRYDAQKIEFQDEYDRISTLCKAKLSRIRKIEKSRDYVDLKQAHQWFDGKKSDIAKSESFYKLKKCLPRQQYDRYANFKRIYKRCRQFPKDKHPKYLI